MEATTNTHQQQSPALTSDEPYRSANLQAQILTVLLLLYIPVALLALASNVLQLGFLNAVAAGASMTQEEIALNKLGQAASRLLHSLASLAAGFAFLFWIHRSYANLPALGNGRETLDFSPRWAVGGFLLPFINLFLPYSVTKEIWQKSDPAARVEDDSPSSTPRSSPLLRAWWLCWVASFLLGGPVRVWVGRGNSVDSLQAATKVFIFEYVFGLAAAVLAVLVVRGITRRQEERSRRVNFVSHTPPPPVFQAPAPLLPPA
jgi:hypothetical protein